MLLLERPDGLVVLVRHLLEHCNLSADTCGHARRLLAHDGLRTLSVQPLQPQEQPPLAFWRRGDDGSPLLILIDLSGAATTVAVNVSAEALRGADDDPQALVAVYRMLTSTSSVSAVASRVPGGIMSCGCQADEPALEVFSRQELAHSQLHAHVPANGLVALRVHCSKHLTDRAHLLSALRRLSQRPSAYAKHNAAATALQRICACADANASGHRLLALLTSLMPIEDGLMAPLALMLSAAVHMAAQAGALHSDELHAPVGGAGAGAGAGAGGRAGGGDEEHSDESFEPIHISASDTARDGARDGVGAPAVEALTATGDRTEIVPRCEALTAAEAAQRATQAIRRALGAISRLAQTEIPPPRWLAHHTDVETSEDAYPTSASPNCFLSVTSASPNCVLSVTSASPNCVLSGPNCVLSGPNCVLSGHSGDAPGDAASAGDSVRPPAAASTPAAAATPAAPLQPAPNVPIARLHRALVEVAQPRRLVLITPELGRWASVGGLGTMTAHLSAALAARGAHVRVIAPAYRCYTPRWASMRLEYSLQVPLGHAHVSVGVRTIQEHGVTVHLLENGACFGAPYPTGDL